MRIWLLTALLSGPALAARTAPPPDVPTLAAQAHQVVHAVVVEADTVRDGPKVQTTYTLRPVRTLSGPQQLLDFEVVLPGGQLGEVTVQAQGVPVWSVDDRVVVFRGEEGHVPLDGALSVDEDRVVDSLAHDRAVPTSLPLLDAAVRAAAPAMPPR